MIVPQFYLPKKPIYFSKTPGYFQYRGKYKHYLYQRVESSQQRNSKANKPLYFPLLNKNNQYECERGTKQGY